MKIIETKVYDVVEKISISKLTPKIEEYRYRDFFDPQDIDAGVMMIKDSMGWIQHQNGNKVICICECESDEVTVQGA